MIQKTLIILAILISQIGFTQNFDNVKLDKYFETLENNNKFIGSVSISKDGKIIYSKSIGFSDIENKKIANSNSKYRIGSISKTFTAVLVLKAMEDNKLDLNQTIDKYFPNIENSNIITIENLLNHRSGIHNFTNDLDYLSWNTEPKTESEMVKIITNAGSDFEPNTKAEYSNSNYVLLSYILEKTFNKSYANILVEYILKPLGLKNTFLGKKINIENNECKSYVYKENWKLESETDISIPLGAGGIVSTPTDLVEFANALFKGKILKKESLELMKKINDGYGLGLFKFPFAQKVAYGHNGGIDGFSSAFVYFPNEDVSFALTSNGSNYNNNNIIIALLSAVFNKPYEIPEFTNYKVSAKDLDKYLGEYSSNQIPLKITITKNEDTLMAQATGQSAFPLEPTEKDIFKFDIAGIVLEFDTTKNTMILKQGGGVFNFVKE